MLVHDFDKVLLIRESTQNEPMADLRKLSVLSGHQDVTTRGEVGRQAYTRLGVRSPSPHPKMASCHFLGTLAESHPHAGNKVFPGI